jgi:rhodanese-related sulfurtransferase
MRKVFGIGAAALVAATFVFAIVAGMGCDSGDGGDGEVTTVEYDELKSWQADGDVLFIDVRPAEDYAAGHIQDAINIDLSALVDGTGGIIDGGGALTEAVALKDTRIVTYCFGFGNDKTFADAALELGYTDVHRYEWGTNEWTTKDYLVIEYSSFKKWHDASFPFDDGKGYLVDDLPEPWYTGDDPDHPGGHIPGALSLPIELWGGNAGPIDDGKALTDLVPEKGAQLVIYCGNPACGKSLVGVQVAVQLGYTNVFRYQGGWQEGQDEGNELKPGLEP